MKELLFFLTMFSICSPTVIRVVDGDTFELSDDRTLRLLDVDCPESENNAKCRRTSSCETEHYGGQRAKDYAHVALSRRASLTGRHDRYGRELGRVTLADGQDLATVLVDSELCRPYR